MSNLNLKDIDNNMLIDIVKCAKEVFCHGIFVPCDRYTGHPCGWDFIDFECMEVEEVFDHLFYNEEISNGIYAMSEFEGLTLKEILEKTDGQFEFEISNIGW